MSASLPKRSRGQTRLPALVVLALGVAVSASACGGYDDLPIRERAFAPMTVTALAAPSRLGPTLLELRLTAPATLSPDAFRPPWVVVGHPTMQSAGGRIIAWARGPCNADKPGDIPDSFIVCATVRWFNNDIPPDPAVVTVVLEARANAQRVTFIGEIPPTRPGAEVSAP